MFDHRWSIKLFNVHLFISHQKNLLCTVVCTQLICSIQTLAEAMHAFVSIIITQLQFDILIKFFLLQYL